MKARSRSGRKNLCPLSITPAIPSACATTRHGPRCVLRHRWNLFMCSTGILKKHKNEISVAASDWARKKVCWKTCRNWMNSAASWRRKPDASCLKQPDSARLLTALLRPKEDSAMESWSRRCPAWKTRRACSSSASAVKQPRWRRSTSAATWSASCARCIARFS